MVFRNLRKEKAGKLSLSSMIRHGIMARMWIECFACSQPSLRPSIFQFSGWLSLEAGVQFLPVVFSSRLHSTPSSIPATSRACRHPICFLCFPSLLLVWHFRAAHHSRGNLSPSPQHPAFSETLRLVVQFQNQDLEGPSQQPTSSEET